MPNLRVDFLFTEFQEGKPVEVIRTGEFVDRYGRDVEVTMEDLDAYVANFEAGAAGQEVPVDVLHERAEAAGWVQSLWREGDRLLAMVDWNEFGKQLVGDKVYRYISATIDTAKKVLKSISLVNFPAVKGLRPVELSDGAYALESGGMRSLGRKILDGIAAGLARYDLADGEPGTVTISGYLQARMHRQFTTIADDLAASGYLSVEERIGLSSAIGDALEVFANNVGEAGNRMIRVDVPIFGAYFGGADEGDYELEDDEEEGGETEPSKEVEMGLTEQERAELRNELRQEILAEFEQKEQTRAELAEELRVEVEAEMAAHFERKRELGEFAAEVCGGDAGLSIDPDELVELMAELDQETADRMKGILKAKVVPFRELGSSREGQGDKKELPAEYAEALDAGEIELSDLQSSILELGDLDQYDLSKWQGRE
jgi:hypothetical protein